MDLITNLVSPEMWQFIKDGFMVFVIWLGFVGLIQVSSMLVSLWLLLLRGENVSLDALTVTFSIMWATFIMIVR